jgi:hypothetical protein
MADGGFKLELEPVLGERLKAAADAAGSSVEDYAAGLISRGLDDDWAEDYARYAEYQRTGEYIDAEVAMRGFREAVAARFRAKRK